MADPVEVFGAAFEGGGTSIMARITGLDGENITQGDINAITLEVFDSAGTSVATPIVGVPVSIFDTLQLDGRWTKDTIGYNFRFDAADTIMTSPGERYRFEFRFEPVTGADFWVPATVTARRILTS